MAKLPIRKAGDPVLKKKSAPVTKFDKKLRRLLDDMAETMYDASGVGLAAPQVGVNERVIIIDVGEGLLELINPEIIKAEGTQVCEQEGCLSVPNFYGTVERALNIEVIAFDRHGKRFKLAVKEFTAQAIQHEIDHLDGILFIEKATSIVKIEPKGRED